MSIRYFKSGSSLLHCW